MNRDIEKNQQPAEEPEVEILSNIPPKRDAKKRISIRLLLTIIILFNALLIGIIVVAVRSDLKNDDEFGQNTQTEKTETNAIPAEATRNLAYKIADTNQTQCFSNTTAIACPTTGSFYGQDANYLGNQPSYADNGDGTATDNVTGLMWQKSAGDKTSYQEAIDGASTLKLAGYDDWRVPTIKEQYSLMDFSGTDPDPMGTSSTGLKPFINTTFFDFEYGDLTTGSRIIDSQWVTTSVYVAKVMNGQECFFGVNFADGRIKCYPTVSRQNAGYFTRYVRGGSYGENNFADNDNGTISDLATSLTWQKSDSGEGVDWEDALGYCQDLTLANNDDWRLPNAKELQSLVDYSRSPESTNSAAINPLFDISAITNEANQKDWPFFWSSTTHIGQRTSEVAAYLSFGRSMGNMSEFGGWIDVHGAGSQRSDPKSGDASQFSDGRGPQGDAVRIKNFVRCVSG